MPGHKVRTPGHGSHLLRCDHRCTARLGALRPLRPLRPLRQRRAASCWLRCWLRCVGSHVGFAVGQTRLLDCRNSSMKVDSNPARRMPPAVSRRGGDGRRCMHGCAWSLSHVSVWVAAVAVAIAPCTSVTTHGQVPSSGLRLRGGMPRDIDGKGGKEMHKWVMQQVRQPYRLCIRFRGRRAGAVAAFDTCTRRRRRRWATRCCRKKSPRYMSRRSERRWRIRSWRPHTPSSSR